MLGPVEEEHLRFVLDWIISFGRAAASRIARDPDSLAGNVGSARAAWFDEFTTEAHVIATGTWPPGCNPDGPG